MLVTRMCYVLSHGKVHEEQVLQAENGSERDQVLKNPVEFPPKASRIYKSLERSRFRNSGCFGNTSIICSQFVANCISMLGQDEVQLALDVLTIVVPWCLICKTGCLLLADRDSGRE